MAGSLSSFFEMPHIGVLVIGVVFYLVLRTVKPYIYDAVMTDMTQSWYTAVLKHCKPKSSMLDVGVGTGSALIANAKILREKNIQVFGVDYDPDYIQKCNSNIDNANLRGNVEVLHRSIYDFVPADNKKYDVIYFSSSLMLVHDPVLALKHVSKFLVPNGTIITTQTFEHKTNRLLEIVKPMIKYFTTVDFGNVTYEKDFMEVIKKAELSITHKEEIPSNSFLSKFVNGNQKDASRSFRLFVMEPTTRK